MFERWRFEAKLAKFQRAQRSVAARFKLEIDAAKKARKSSDEIESIKYQSHFEDMDFDGAIAQLQTFYLIDLAQRHLVPLPAVEDWENDETSLPYRYLKAEPRARLRAAIRAEQDAIWARKVRWVPFLTAITGALGATIGVLSFISKH